MIKGFATKLAKFALRLLPAYPEGDYKPLDQITDDAALRLARVAYEDESESGCGLLDYFDDQFIPTGGMILDLGCGFGGRTLAYQRITRGYYVGLEIDARMSAGALRFVRSINNSSNNSTDESDAAFAAAVGEALPFASDSFDAVLCYDVFEHVQDPELTLTEIYRVLKPGGRLLTVFPPYYHPKGAHLDGYVSRLPYANVLFPSKVLIGAVDELLEERGNGYRPQQLRPGDKLYALNGLTIRKFIGMLPRSKFEISKLEMLPLLNRMIRQYDKLKMRYYAWAFYPLSRTPGLREMFTHRIVAVVRKPQRPASQR